MLAARTASALPASSTSAMCSSVPAPPLATTGTPTASLTRRVMTRSNPAFVPSASMEFKTISPAPSATAFFAQSIASSPVSLRPPCENTPHLSGAIFFASIETTMHWLPNFSAPARIKFGVNVVSLAMRDPVLLAKQCATIDVLSEGRLLPGFGIGSPRGPEWQALHLDPATRGKTTDEALEIIHRLWSGEKLDYDGRHFKLTGASIAPLPVQPDLPMWIGGSSEG